MGPRPRDAAGSNQDRTGSARRARACRRGEIRPDQSPRRLTRSGAMRASASKSRSQCSTVSWCRSAQAAIRQSTPERTVSPARRAVRKRPIACSKTSSVSGEATIGSASSDSCTCRNTRSSSIPWRTSCSTGRHRTTSSRSTRAEKGMRCGRRNSSIHADVSTRITGATVRRAAGTATAGRRASRQDCHARCQSPRARGSAALSRAAPSRREPSPPSRNRCAHR
jgi:hypothetical protein